MARSMYQAMRLGVLLIIILGTTSSIALPHAPPTEPQALVSSGYIVQASSTDAAAAAVAQAGGAVSNRLEIINGVAATVDQVALKRLQRNPHVSLYPDLPVHATSGGTETDTQGYLLYPSAATGVHKLHGQKVSTPKTECKQDSTKQWRVAVSSDREERELKGWGVTVAVVDSGFMKMKMPSDWTYEDSATNTLIAANSGRCLVYRDFLPRQANYDNLARNPGNSTDQHGHGTHVVSTIADNREAVLAPNSNATPVGVAPQVNLMIARALGSDGSGSYGDVIASIDWIVANKALYNVRVLNLSLYSPVTGPYWADPLNQAVMKAWQAGIVVVAAAGNQGPEAGTITVPGNVPYVITVGSLKSGRYAASGQDELAGYSSRGPTESAFVKPDVLVPGTRTIAAVPNGSTVVHGIPEARIEDRANVDYKIGSPAQAHTYYQLSGTSMAAAEVSGIVALMLQANPTLTNDQVKYRLLTTARAAVDDGTGKLSYSMWEQGAGLVSAQQAVFSTETGRANEGMNIALDLTSDTHYWGMTIWDPTRHEFMLTDPDSGETIVWDGRTRSWAGRTRSWAGRTRSWAGSDTLWAGRTRSWAGGTTSWAGSDSLWAGRTRSWAGSTPATSLDTASHTEFLISDDPHMNVYIPMLIR